MASVIAHANETIGFVRSQADEAILFYSGGKDSLVLLDLIAPKFKRVVCVFMYFVKDMQHIQIYLDHAKKYPNVEILQLPHWILSHIYKEGLYCKANPKQPLRQLRHVIQYAKQETRIDWAFLGMKQADSLQRRLMLKTYKDEAISEASQCVYPLSKWKKADVLAYIKMRRLPKPIDYGIKSASSGLTFNKDVFAWLRTHYPADLEKIYAAFPLSRQLLFEYDYERANQVPDGN